MLSLEEQLSAAKAEAEFHAHGVRQAVKHIGRIYRLLENVGRLHDLNAEADLSLVLKLIQKSPTEVFQDIYCMLLNGGKRQGFFVEFGACDGKLLSNTILLEKEFGWNGILSEPLPHWHSSLRENRTCIIDERCVWSSTGSFIEFNIFEGDEYKTESSASRVLAPARKPVRSKISVETVSLHDLLLQHGAPKKIDFLSIDVEGTEYEVLKNFPFSEYVFDFICVERLSSEKCKVHELLLENDYTQIFEEEGEDDGFYVRADNRYLSGLLKRTRHRLESVSTPAITGAPSMKE